MVRITAFVSLLSIVFALQTPERHFGCPPGKNACIYPIDDAALQCETYFDFQVALHVKENTPLGASWRNELDIKLTLPDGSVVMPEALFNKQPELRKWKLKAYKDAADETPAGFDSYAAVWRNVILPRRIGKGRLAVSVHARRVTTSVHWQVRAPSVRRAKNVILLIGDGMSLPMMAAARLVSRGMYHGKYRDLLNMEKLSHFGLQNPSGVDSIITDSANSASSFNSGHKTSVNALGVYADSGDDNFAHPKVETIAEHIKRKFGMAVGVVTTAEVQDATPAAVWSHTRRRAEKAVITSQAINGCRDCVGIVMPDVLMGGGGKYFLPGHSVDSSDMYKNYSDKGYTVTHTRSEMLVAANDPATKRLLTITHRGNMEVWLDRNRYTENMNVPKNDPKGLGVPPTDQPNLDEMVMSALSILSKNEKGFFLQVEAASIDKSAHPLDVPRLISDLIELDNTVGKVVDWIEKNDRDTLIIATADHAHGFDVYGTVDTKLYKDAVTATEEQPVPDVDNYCSAVMDLRGRLFSSEVKSEIGQKIREANLARRKSIGIYNGAGYPDFKDSNGDGFPDSWDVRTTLAAGMNNFPDHTEDFRVSKIGKRPTVHMRVDKRRIAFNNPKDAPNGIFISGNLPPGAPKGVHTMQDVGIFASGPGSDAVKGIFDNTEVYHIIASALGFGTNGERPARRNIKRCVNDGRRCHCQKMNGSYRCSCLQDSPTVYVKSPEMCAIVDGRLMRKS